MSFNRLQALCGGVCTLLGTPAPSLGKDRHGVVAFTLDLAGTPVTVLQRTEPDPETGFVLVELGALPPELELAALRELMEANFALLARDAPRFSRHPVHHTVLLQWHFDLATATPQTLHASILRGASLADDWLDLARSGLPNPASAQTFA